MEKIKNVSKILFWPILLGIIQIIIFVISFFFFINIKSNEFTGNKLNDYINSNNFNMDLLNFMSTNIYIIILSLLLNCIFIIYLYKYYKKIVKMKTNKITYKPIIINSIVICLLLNLILPNKQNNVDFSIYLLITTSLLGPVVEELIFRGLIYNKLTINNKKSKILTTILFSLIHLNIIKIIYSFFIGLYFIYLQEKYQNIKTPIISHITMNSFIYLIFPYIFNLSDNIKIILIILLIIYTIFTIIKSKICIKHIFLPNKMVY